MGVFGTFNSGFLPLSKNMAVILIGDFKLPSGVCGGVNGVCFLAHLWDQIAVVHQVNAAYIAPPQKKPPPSQAPHSPRPKAQIQNKRWLTQNGWLRSGEISAVMESL